MHRLLERQLRKLGIDPEQGPENVDEWKSLLERLDQSYQEADRDRYTLERSLMLSSEEMAHLYQELKLSSESELSREKALLQSLIDSIPDLIFVKDLNGVYLSNNSAFEEFVGFGSKEIIGKTDYDLFQRDVAAFFREQDQKMLRAGVSRRNEEWVSYPDGRRVLLETLKTPYRGPDGEILGLIGISRDSTERERIENRLRQAAVVFQNTGDSVIITDINSNIIAVNQAFTEVMGYTEDEVMGKNANIIQSGKHDEPYYKTMWDQLNTSGHWRGQIWNRHKSGQVVPGLLSINAVEDEAGSPTHYVGVFTDISDIKRAEDELHHLAHHDPLTGLPNRLLFGDRLSHTIEHAHRNRQQFALLFLDIDRFKYINDSLGHAMGDQLLQEIARRLQRCIRGSDTVARLGGDEYLIILDNIHDVSYANRIAMKITEAIAEPVELDDRSLRISASLGISLYPQDGDDPVTLTKHADTAMYRAKEEGRDRIRFYSPEMTTRAFQHLAMENNLRRALDNGEFELYYQPQIDLISQKIVGVEALLRWNAGERGIVGPDEFIPIAEDTGLILPIGEWVLTEACRQLNIWRQMEFDDLEMSINLSGIQLLGGDLTQCLAGILESCASLEQGKVTLELTESVLMEDADAALEVMDELKKLGLRLSIDDFGTGYSSMSYLKRFPVDELKIDRSFIKDILDNQNDRAIIEAILALGHSLGLKVVAEGAEDIHQVKLLQTLSCDRCQGFHFSKPLPAAEMTAMLEQTRLNTFPEQE